MRISVPTLLPAVSSMLLGLAGSACKADPVEAGKGKAAPSASAPALTPRCRSSASDDFVTRVGTGEQTSSEDDDPIGLPFAAELGTAGPLGSGFAVTALEHDGRASQAVAIVIGAEGASRKIPLGAVHGGVVPPRHTARGDRLFVAVADSAAVGTTLRLGRIDGTAASPKVVFGAEIPQGNDDSQAFSIELADEERGAVVWDEWDKKAGRGRIVGMRFRATDVQPAGDPLTLSDASSDAESPRLVLRRGGYWLAWIENVGRGPEKKLPPGEPAAGGLILGPRRIVLAPLSADLERAGTAISVTAEGAHALTFDLTPSADGGALVAWRDDRTSPANPGGILFSAKVGADGSVLRHVVVDEEVGGGAPILLEHQGGRSWLAYTTPQDAVRLAIVGPTGAPTGPATDESPLGGAIPIAGQAERLLVAKPRGRTIELATVRCRL